MHGTLLAGAGVVVLLLGLPAPAGALSIGQLDGDDGSAAFGLRGQPVAGSRYQSSLPPVFSSSMTSTISTPRSIPLTMS